MSEGQQGTTLLDMQGETITEQGGVLGDEPISPFNLIYSLM